jgi:hypothetical protein
MVSFGLRLIQKSPEPKLDNPESIYGLEKFFGTIGARGGAPKNQGFGRPEA